jgi:hypothetical protein
VPDWFAQPMIRATLIAERRRSGAMLTSCPVSRALEIAPMQRVQRIASILAIAGSLAYIDV